MNSVDSPDAAATGALRLVHTTDAALAGERACAFLDAERHEYLVEFFDSAGDRLTGADIHVADKAEALAVAQRYVSQASLQTELETAP